MYANSKLVNGSTCTRLVHVCFLPPVPSPPPSLPLDISCSLLQGDWAIDFIHLHVSLEVGLPEQSMGLGLGLVVEDKPSEFSCTCTSGTPH